MKEIAASLDIGTNSTLFLLAEIQPDGSIRPLMHAVRTNDLGRGLDAQGNLRPETIALNLSLLRDFRRIAEEHGARRIVAAATDALRRARNGRELIELARRELKMEIRVLSGEEEARLTYLGVRSGYPDEDADLIVADVGGGSTEVIRGKGKEVTFSISLPVGAVVMDQRHIHSDPPADDQIEAVRRSADEVLRALPPDLKHTDAELVICGGTASSLAAADLGLETYLPEKIAGHPMTLTRLRGFIAQFSKMTLDQRRKVPGIGHRRAEIILPGTLLIERLLLSFDRERYFTSERGLRYGLLAVSGEVENFT